MKNYRIHILTIFRRQNLDILVFMLNFFVKWRHFLRQMAPYDVITSRKLIWTKNKYNYHVPCQISYKLDYLFIHIYCFFVSKYTKYIIYTLYLLYNIIRENLIAHPVCVIEHILKTKHFQPGRQTFLDSWANFLSE